MAINERKYLEKCLEAGICPYCKGALSRGRCGTGRTKEGVFCSLDCFARYHALTLKQKQQRLLKKD
jgi:hypothetical protein